MTRIPAAMAGLALIAVTAVACGSDDGDDATAADPAASSSPSGSTAPSEMTSDSPSTSASPTDSDDPVPSPIVNKAVKAAIADGFPALVPAGVPEGWTVTSATYSPKRGGSWRIELTNPDGAPVTLLQSTAAAADLAAQLLPDAQPTDPVKLSGTGKWDTYAGSGGAALAKDLSGTGAAVAGPDQDTVVTLAEELLTAEDAGTDDGG